MSQAMDDTKLRHVARRIRDLTEPLAASVYFAPEVHAAYEALGFGGGFRTKTGLHYPDLPAYFTSRGACMGTVPGEVVTAAFGVFPAHVVVPAVTEGWQKTTREEILAARLEGQIAGLRNVLGAEPDGAAQATELLRTMAGAGFAAGHHLYAGLSSLPWPDDPIGGLFRAADLVREHRGDSHITAWTAAGLDPVEICLMSDVWMDQPLKTVTWTRGWTQEEMDAGIERLRSRGLIDGEVASDAGRQLRDEIEWVTDLQERPLCEAIGNDMHDLFAFLGPWAETIVERHYYPKAPKKPV